MKIQKRLQKRKQKKPLPTIGTELHAARYHPNFTGRQHTPVISVHSVTGMSRSGPPGRLGSGFALGWAEGLSPLPLSLGPPLTHGLPHGHDPCIIAWLFLFYHAFSRCQGRKSTNPPGILTERWWRARKTGSKMRLAAGFGFLRNGLEWVFSALLAQGEGDLVQLQDLGGDVGLQRGLPGLGRDVGEIMG